MQNFKFQKCQEFGPDLIFISAGFDGHEDVAHAGSMLQEAGSSRLPDVMGVMDDVVRV